MAEITGLDFKTLYGKIEFIHRQCLAFAANRERQMLEGLALPKMYVAVDRQAYVVNWSSRKDRRNVMLTAIGSADIWSHYVFGLHLNLDGQLDPKEIEAHAIAAGDYLVAEPYRQYACLWPSAIIWKRSQHPLQRTQSQQLRKGWPPSLHKSQPNTQKRCCATMWKKRRTRTRIRMSLFPSWACRYETNTLCMPISNS